MLLLSIFTLSIAGASALGSISPRGSFDSPIVVRQTTVPCATECSVPLSVVANCSASADPFCGCSQFVPAAGSCETCLAQTNTTIGGIVDALFIAEAVVLCNCQSPSCGDLILSARQCQATDPTNTNCTCPAVVKETDCYTCMETNDTSIAAALRADVSRCKAFLSEASPSSTASASPSSSGLPLFTSDGGMMRSVQNSVWFSLNVFVIGLVYAMF